DGFTYRPTPVHIGSVRGDTAPGFRSATRMRSLPPVRSRGLACSEDLAHRDHRWEELGRPNLGRAPPVPLLGEDLPVGEKLPTPDAPGLAAFERGLEAPRPARTRPAELLRSGDVVELLREEELGQGGRAVAAQRLVPPRLVVGHLPLQCEHRLPLSSRFPGR